jgi:hypothetical protein
LGSWLGVIHNAANCLDSERDRDGPLRGHRTGFGRRGNVGVGYRLTHHAQRRSSGICSLGGVGLVTGAPEIPPACVCIQYACQGSIHRQYPRIAQLKSKKPRSRGSRSGAKVWPADLAQVFASQLQSTMRTRRRSDVTGQVTLGKAPAKRYSDKVNSN